MKQILKILKTLFFGNYGYNSEKLKQTNESIKWMYIDFLCVI